MEVSVRALRSALLGVCMFNVRGGRLLLEWEYDIERRRERLQSLSLLKLILNNKTSIMKLIHLLTDRLYSLLSGRGYHKDKESCRGTQ